MKDLAAVENAVVTEKNEEIERLRIALRKAINIAWRRGRNEFPPEDSDLLAELADLVV